MKQKSCWGLILMCGVLVACSPSQPPPPDTRLSDAIKRPMDKARSVEDDVMRAKEEMDRQLEEQEK